MGTILQIAGGIFVAILVFLLLIIWWGVRKWRHFKRLISEGGGEQTPSAIHLVEDPEADWIAEEGPAPILGALRGEGFAPGRCYTIPEMPDFRLTSLFHPGDAVCCALYDHPQVGNWVDLVVQYQDGEELTVTNAPHGEEIDYRPEVRKIFRPGADISSLMAVLKENLEEKERIRITDDTFRGAFEEAYRKDMKWRNDRGGVSEEEVRRVARRMGQEFTEEQIADATGEIKIQELDRLHEECLERFAQETDMSVSQWTRYQEAGEMMIVSDTLDREAFSDYLAEHFDLTGSQAEMAEELARKRMKPSVIFQAVNETRSPALRAQRIGSVSAPIEAEVFFLPTTE